MLLIRKTFKGLSSAKELTLYLKGEYNDLTKTIYFRKMKNKKERKSCGQISNIACKKR